MPDTSGSPTAFTSVCSTYPSFATTLLTWVGDGGLPLRSRAIFAQPEFEGILALAFCLLIASALFLLPK